MAPTPTPTTVEESEWSPEEFLKGMYLAFGVLGLLSNGLVLIVFIRVRSLRTITNLFIGNQSLIDLVSSALLLMTFYRESDFDFTKVGRAYGLPVCLFWTSNAIYWSLVNSSTLNLVVITMERYVAVFRPHIYRQRVNWKSASAVAAGVWVSGFIIQLPWPMIHRLEEGRCFPDWGSSSAQALFGTMIYLVTLIIPSVLMIWVYLSIFRKLRSKVGNGSTSVSTDRPNETTGVSRISGSNMAAGEGARDHSVGNDQHRKIRMNVIKTLLLAALVFIICWTPNHTLFLLYTLGHSVDLHGVLKTASVCLAFSNMWINPFIYAFKYRKFQYGLKVLFHLKSSDGSPQ